MNGRKVSAALNALPEDMVAEAMEPGRSGRGFSWLRLAACLAIVAGLCFGFWPAQPEIVTAPGLLTVTVYAMDGSDESMVISEYLDDIVVFPYSYIYHPAVSCVPGLPIALMIEDDCDVMFEVTLSGGSILIENNKKYEQMSQTFTLSNNSCIYWRPWSVDATMNDEDEAYSFVDEDIVYADILILKEGHIIGFAVLAFERRYDGETVKTLEFEARLVESVCYPQVGGEYQEVTMEYVRSQMEEVKVKDAQFIRS